MLKRWILAALTACAITLGAAPAADAEDARSPQAAPPTIDCRDCEWD